MRRILHDNSLSIAFFGLFLIFLSGQAVSGYFAFNQQQEDHGRGCTGFGAYLASGHFLEGVFENWESEFLQIGANVLLSIFLLQKGSAVSKKLPATSQAAGPKMASSSYQGPRPAHRRWAGSAALRELVGPRIRCSLPSLFRASCILRSPAVQSAAARARQTAGLRFDIPRNLRVLVPVAPELSERVPRARFNDGSLNLPTAERISPLQARGAPDDMTGSD